MVPVYLWFFLLFFGKRFLGLGRNRRGARDSAHAGAQAPHDGDKVTTAYSKPRDGVASTPRQRHVFKRD